MVSPRLRRARRALAIPTMLAAALCARPASAMDAPAAPAPGAGVEDLHLSRREAVERALAANPGLLAAREQVEEARAQVVVAAAIPDPSLAADAPGETQPLNPGSRSGSDVGFGVTVPFPGKTGLRRAVATSSLRAAEFSLAQARQQVASSTAEAYDQLLVSLRHGEDLQESRKYAEEFLHKTEARFAGGTAAKLDVIKARVDRSQADEALIANERAVATARAGLNRLLGRLGGAPLAPTDTLEVPPPLPDLEALEKTAESERPEVRSLAAQREGARAATRLAREFWAPDLDLSLQRNTLPGTPATYTAGVAIGFPLFFWQHRNGEVAAARHREQELAADVADLAAQVSLDVRSAYAAAATARRQAEFIRDQLLPEARDVFRVASVSYGLGGSSALELLDAKRTLLGAESDYADALGAANDAEAALELAVGAPLASPDTGARP